MLLLLLLNAQAPRCCAGVKSQYIYIKQTNKKKHDKLLQKESKKQIKII